MISAVGWIEFFNTQEVFHGHFLDGWSVSQPEHVSSSNIKLGDGDQVILTTRLGMLIMNKVGSMEL